MAFSCGKRVRGIEPPCAAWEAAVLPLNYTREEISDFRFAIADCNRNKFAIQVAVRRCPQRIFSVSHAERLLRPRTLQQELIETCCNHCHEITSSDALKFVPCVTSAPNDHAITP